MLGWGAFIAVLLFIGMLPGFLASSSFCRCWAMPRGTSTAARWSGIEKGRPKAPSASRPGRIKARRASASVPPGPQPGQGVLRPWPAGLPDADGPFEMRAAFDGDGLVDDVSLDPRGRGQAHLQPAHAAHDAAIDHDVIGHDLAPDVALSPTVSRCARMSPSTVPSTWMSPVVRRLPTTVRSDDRTEADALPLGAEGTKSCWVWSRFASGALGFSPRPAWGRAR